MSWGTTWLLCVVITSWRESIRWLNLVVIRFYTSRSELALSRSSKVIEGNGTGEWTIARSQSIKWCHFQWPWTNPNPMFNVTPLLALNISNGYRYGHSYYRPEQTNTYTWNSIILSLTNVTDRQKSPVFCCKKYGNPRSLSGKNIDKTYFLQTAVVPAGLRIYARRV